MTDVDILEKIRNIRRLENPKLKPSPYLKDRYTNEFGEEKPIVIRDYQIRGIMNLLQMPNNILAFDTGLGKTLTVLNVIGYIWMKEPEYVPIIITTKSALFQWESECYRFMQNMTPVIVHGEPHERHGVYCDFFKNNDGKKLLTMSYDTLMRDLDSSVVKDKGHKANPADKKALKAARETERDIKKNLEIHSSALKDISDSGTFETAEYIMLRSNGKSVSPPPGWKKDHELTLNDVLDSRKNLLAIQNEIQRLVDLVSPPIKTDGILDLMVEYKSKFPDTKYILIFDEAHKVKNYRSQVHEKIKAVSGLCDRIIAMTATPVKNRLMEFFGIFRVVQPALFPKVTQFQNEYCVMKMQRIPGGRQVPVVVGYKNLDKFVNTVEPYFLSCKKHEVAKELPELISMEVQCELSDIQDDLYDMAENGVDNLSDDDNYGDVLSSLVMCQQAVNAPQLILNEEGVPFEGPSSKIEALLDIIENSEDQKIIIFSRFEKMISVVEKTFIKSDIKYVRITGKESDPKIRQVNREKFQDPNSGVNIILITMAGSESLNLQAAEQFIFIDLPWSIGDLNQLIGRMIRIGSSHKTVVAHYLLGIRRSGEKTIDHHVLKALQSKQKLVHRVTGKDVDVLNMVKVKDEDTIQDILSAMRNNTKPKPDSSKKKVVKQSKVVKTKSDNEIESINVDFSDI